ncbi:anthrax toxin lethal factor-related metalloendopeptidase [Brevibacillus laterosporus]|uniref:anthrax toxin lethal factor-related metalloendopeptidase n=1 Tax=Brevibacillus laterosporus TaxID=1465 RepID=UPI000E6BADCE|nr:ADP-ribosyltransferase [Brevibacillus laterosporus]AYB37557.1 lethal factor domain protein [Brevibacillus laterosporus]MBM7111353.1 putative ADP-ribosyltransferase Certhrax [Brevibacillus laterosporus]
MSHRNKMLKVLSTTTMLLAFTAASPAFSYITHAANGIHDVEDKKKEDKEKKEKEDKEKKEREKKSREERMKEIIKEIVTTEVKSEEEQRLQDTQELLKKLSPEVLEMYEKAGGKIHLTDKRIIENPTLRDISEKEKQIKDSEGNEVSLDSHFVFSIGGKNPALIIHTEEYSDSHSKSKEVYYEIGKAIARDTLSESAFANEAFLDALHQAKTDEDASALLLSHLPPHEGEYDAAYVKEHINEFREVFAQAFAYYYEPSYQSALKAYAPEMFRYMDDMSKKGFNEINTQLKEEQTTPLDFKSDIDAAKEFGAKIKLSDTVVTKEDKKFMDGYVAYGPMLNRILRGIDKHPGISDIDMFIHGIDNLFKKEEAKLPNDLIVYRRTDEREFALPAGSLFTKDGNVNHDAINKLKKLEGKIKTDKGFISTSLALNSVPLGGNQESILIQMKLPKGTPAIYMDNSWLELLLKRDSSYKILNVKGIVLNGKIVVSIETELLPEKQKK